MIQAHVEMLIRWTKIHRINGRSLVGFRSNAPCSATCPAKKKFHVNIVPHERNNGKTRVYKVGRNNVLALPPQLSNQSPLTCGPFTCHPPSRCHVAPPGRPCGLAWFCHVSALPPRVGLCGSATWPCVPCCIRAGYTRHVNSASPVEIKTPFCILKGIGNQ